ncbi:glycosyl hydrolase family 18 protein, partial [Vibrio parahaemolyticus]|nr:glycosyl hydrolase family 18 protein [Vibrio parahaemolyticus]
RRQYLWASYQELMKVLREKLDAASAQDGIHYMLTIAAPSSGYLLRGMETFDVTKYLDYVNIMSYDLHGAWNDHVGHNAALFDTGKDSELAQWNVYGTAAYGGIGYLNTDWAYHYFRGSMPAGRINIGVPYYTRGWQGVTGGDNGLWGRAALPNQAECQPGTGESEKNNCGHCAIGIDNMWHDTDPKGNE